MVFCNQCYESPPICMNGTPGVTACQMFRGLPAVHRNGAGTYGAGWRSGLPEEMKDLDDAHIDYLAGHVTASAAIVVMSVANTEFREKLVQATMQKTELGDAGNYLTDHPEDFSLVKRNVNRLFGEYSAIQVSVAVSILNQVEQASLRVQLLSTATTRPQAATTAEFKQRAEPLAALFQQLIKRIEKGDVPADDSATIFDPFSGKTLIPFAKSTKVTSGANLIYAVHLLVVFWKNGLKKAPCVYFRFVKTITQVTGTHGFTIAHKFTDALLRKLDEGYYSSPVALFKAGEHIAVLDIIQRQQATVDADPGASSRSGLTGARYQFYGPVTTPMGGPGAGAIPDYITKLPRLRTRFHASPQQACTAGVMAGHPSGKVGWCMFAH